MKTQLYMLYMRFQLPLYTVGYLCLQVLSAVVIYSQLSVSTGVTSCRYVQ